jgi:sec-independent protein translocase protein TatA
MDIGAPEILIVLALAILLFGVGRIGKIGGELGKSIRDLRDGLQSDDTPAASNAPPAVEPPTTTSAQ